MHRLRSQGCSGHWAPSGRIRLPRAFSRPNHIPGRGRTALCRSGGIARVRSSKSIGVRHQRLLTIPFCGGRMV
jgi:hypothetical protein